MKELSTAKEISPQDQFGNDNETLAESASIADCHVLLLASKDVFHRRGPRFKVPVTALVADYHALPRGLEGCCRFPTPRFKALINTVWSFLCQLNCGMDGNFLDNRSVEELEDRRLHVWGFIWGALIIFSLPPFLGVSHSSGSGK